MIRKNYNTNFYQNRSFCSTGNS